MIRIVNWIQKSPYLCSRLTDFDEEAYGSAVGKPLVDADDEELVKLRSSLRRSRIDGVNLPSTRDQGTRRPDESSMSRAQLPETQHDMRPARVPWRSPSVSGRSNDENFGAPVAVSFKVKKIAGRR